MAIYKEAQLHTDGAYTFKDVYDFYIDNLVDKDKPNNPYLVDRVTFNKILGDYFKAIVDYMLYDNYIFDPGMGIGKFFIAKQWRGKMNNLAINWVETKKQGKLVHYLNEHTNNYIYRFMWKVPPKNSYTWNYMSSYRFLPTRSNKRTLARLILDEGYDYFEYKNKDIVKFGVDLK